MFRRFACVRQTDQSDCGAAALATIAKHHKRPIAVHRLRELAGTDRVGTNLRGLVDAAQHLGFVAKAVKCPLAALQDVPLPAIAHILTKDGLGHFVVLHRVGAKTVLLADPGNGIQRQNIREFELQWTGYLLLLTPDESRPFAESEARDVSPLRRLCGLLACHKGVLAEGFFCALLMTLLGISTSYFVQHLVDSVLVRGEKQLLNALGIGMALILVFRTLFGLLRQYLLAHVGRKVDLSLISSYARHVLNLPTRFFEMRQVGEILSRVNDAGKIRDAINGTALTAIVDAVMVAFSMTVLWIYDVRLAAVSTAFVPILMIAVMLHHSRVKKSARETMEHGAKLSAHLVEDISGVDTIKAFNLQGVRAEKGEMGLFKLVHSAFSLQKLGMSLGTIGTFVTGSAGVVVLWYGGHRVMDGALTIGQLMFFHTLLGYLLDPLGRLASVSLDIQDALVAVDRLYQVLDMDVEQVKDVRRAKFSQFRRSIEFHSVSFRYGCRDEVLRDINLSIPAGKTVAIVGESGSGKSTLLKLLMKFYDPTSGQVTLDGTDYRDFDLESLRNRIGLVSQEPFVFNATVFENVAMGCESATMDEVVAATRAAGLSDFIDKLPDRYETLLGERGANLSGGQRQRLAIARALLRKPELIIFDEATSHLDTATERSIQSSMQSALFGKTVVMVAHRLSTVKNADLIYVMQDGGIIEQGDHQTLLSRDGLYASLWKTQIDVLPEAVCDFPVRVTRTPILLNGGTNHGK